MAIISPNTEMRLRYLASEKGDWLRFDTLDILPATAATLSLIRAYDGSVAVGTGASLATIATAVVAVDPTITSAT